MKKGFLFFAANTFYFLESDNKNITKNIISQFIQKIGTVRNINKSVIERALKDEETRKHFRFQITQATIENKGKDDWKYLSVTGSNFCQSIPEKEIENYFIIL